MDPSIMARIVERLQMRFPGEDMDTLLNLMSPRELMGMMQEEEARAATWYPSSEEVLADHRRKLREMQQAEGPVDTGWAAPSADAAGGATAPLSRLRLEGLHTSVAPLRGAVVGGTLAAASFRFHPTEGAISCVLREDGSSSIVRLALYNAPLTIRDCREGRRVVIKNVWMKRYKDGWPGLRVDDPADVLWDTTVDEVQQAHVEHRNLSSSPSFRYP